MGRWVQRIVLAAQSIAHLRVHPQNLWLNPVPGDLQVFDIMQVLEGRSCETVGSFCGDSGLLFKPSTVPKVYLSFGLEPVEQEFSVSPQHLCHLLHGFEPRAHGPGCTRSPGVLKHRPQDLLLFWHHGTECPYKHQNEHIIGLQPARYEYEDEIPRVPV